MPYPKNFHLIILHPIYYDVGSATHDSFAGSLNASPLSNLGMVT
jgi:hypothetical protein